MATSQFWEDKARAHGHVAATYLDPVLRAFETPLRRRVFFATVPVVDGQRILDIGTGVGEWALEFWRRGARVTGVDVSPTMIGMARELAEQHHARIEYSVFSVQNLSRQFSGRFDLVTSFTVLQHLLTDDDLRAALERCHEALAEDGRFACMEYTELRRTRPPVYGAYMTYRSRDEWTHLFAQAGFSLDRLAVVRRRMLVWGLLGYEIFARLRWRDARPRTLTWEGRVWCGGLRAWNWLLERTTAPTSLGDLTLFVLKKR